GRRSGSRASLSARASASGRTASSPPRLSHSSSPLRPGRTQSPSIATAQLELHTLMMSGAGDDDRLVVERVAAVGEQLLDAARIAVMPMQALALRMRDRAADAVLDRLAAEAGAH